MKFKYALVMAVTALIFNACSSTKPESIISNGEVYEVNGKEILKNGENITQSLEDEERSAIFNLRDNKIKTRERAEAVQKKAEKALNEATKAQEKAEKELKAKQNAQEDFEKASKKLLNAQEKYDRLKRKGDLSPNDEEKWTKDLKKLKENVEKYKKRMIRS